MTVDSPIDLFAMRSLLFLPASNPRAIGHARESGADLVILDLEDAVKPDDKDAARAAAVEAVGQGFPMPVAIRINSLRTEWHGLDIGAVMEAKPDLIVIPRAVGKEEIVAFTVALNRFVSLDHEAVFETWNRKARWLNEQLQEIPGLHSFYRKNAYGFGEIRFEWDQKVIRLTPDQVREKLKDGEPRIVYYDDDKGGTIQTRTMKDGEEIFAARRLREFFLQEGRRA